MKEEDDDKEATLWDAFMLGVFIGGVVIVVVGAVHLFGPAVSALGDEMGIKVRDWMHLEYEHVLTADGKYHRCIK